jgi:hypothetical protein
MLSVLVVLVMGVCLWAQASTKTSTSSKTCYATKEEIQVYAGFLRGESSPANPTVLVTKTEAWIQDMDTLNLMLAAKGHGIPPDLRTDFTVKNKSSCLITSFEGVPNLRFISKGEESTIFVAGWEEFHKKYGKGAEVVTVSRVGFNSDKTLALLHIIGAKGRMAATGELYVLERKDGKWVIKFNFQTMAT